ncbi:YxlC family protein [Paenibacillus daejeonensis]|uniref:YxlC family protein n=1 Tax=Paenibacillus daejeonensis TaxID=135193 RepID=UPI00037FD496|nr:YxlC family protein [Paenibacillus daejeonensis]
MKKSDDRGSRTSRSDELGARFREGLDGLDSWTDQEAPDLPWLEDLIRHEQDQLQRRWRWELAVFLIIALLLVSTVMTVLFRSPTLFVISQGAFLIIPLLILLWRYRRRRKQVNHEEPLA